MSSEFRQSEQRRAQRKALQLAQQVERALYWALGTSCDDPVLQSLNVASVEPSPKGGPMFVTLVAGEGVDAADAMRRLNRAYGLLRSEVAREIHRRKVPELTFRVLEE